MDRAEIVRLLNSLQKYSLEYRGSAYYQEKELVEDTFGDLVKAEDLAKLFDIKYGHVYCEGDKFQE